MKVKFNLPIVSIIACAFFYLIGITFLTVYLYYKLNDLQNLNTELMNQLNSLQISLAEIKMQSVESVQKKTLVNTLNDSQIYRDLLKYIVYSIGILAFVLSFYYVSCYFFSNCIDVNAVFILLKKANAALF